MEQCPECGYQLIGCGCYGQVEELDGEVIRPPCGEWPKDEIRIPWSGHSYGTTEIVEAGWFCKDENGKCHIPCDRNDPKAWPALNRLIEMDWDKMKRRFVLRNHQSVKR